MTARIQAVSVKVARGKLWVCEKGTGKEDPNPVHVGLRYLLDIQAENHKVEVSSGLSPREEA